MPNIKKAEYDNLKMDIKMLELLLLDAKNTIDGLQRDFITVQHAAEKWKRYYDAVRETFKVDEEVQIPGCFSPMDTVKFIVEQQEKE